MEIFQIIILVVIALIGIPAGFFLKNRTKEEMKPGRKWFRTISVLSALVFFISLIFAREDDLALLLSSMAFVFFISYVPLVKFNKK